MSGQSGRRDPDLERLLAYPNLLVGEAEPESIVEAAVRHGGRRGISGDAVGENSNQRGVAPLQRLQKPKHERPATVPVSGKRRAGPESFQFSQAPTHQQGIVIEQRQQREVLPPRNEVGVELDDTLESSS